MRSILLVAILALAGCSTAGSVDTSTTTTTTPAYTASRSEIRAHQQWVHDNSHTLGGLMLASQEVEAASLSRNVVALRQQCNAVATMSSLLTDHPKSDMNDLILEFADSYHAAWMTCERWLMFGYPSDQSAYLRLIQEGNAGLEEFGQVALARYAE